MTSAYYIEAFHSTTMTTGLITEFFRFLAYSRFQTACEWNWSIHTRDPNSRVFYTLQIDCMARHLAKGKASLMILINNRIQESSIQFSQSQVTLYTGQLEPSHPLYSSARVKSPSIQFSQSTINRCYSIYTNYQEQNQVLLLGSFHLLFWPPGPPQIALPMPLQPVCLQTIFCQLFRTLTVATILFMWFFLLFFTYSYS